MITPFVPNYCRDFDDLKVYYPASCFVLILLLEFIFVCAIVIGAMAIL